MTTAALNPLDVRRVVAALSYGELAMAVAVSDMPTTRLAGQPEDALSYAAQGLARVGLAEIQRRVAESARLVDVKYFGSDRATRRAAAVRHAALWGGARRFDRTHDLADRIWLARTLPAAA